jgi:hypothetical protein
MGVSAAPYAASVAGHAVNGVNPIPQCVAGQCSQLTGGNTALKPEQGETYTVGINSSDHLLAFWLLTAPARAINCTSGQMSGQSYLESSLI